MKQVEAVIASTRLDSQGERLTRDALVSLAESIGRKFVPVGEEHDPRKPPIGRLLSAAVQDREDGESEVLAILEIFDEDEPAKEVDDREIVLRPSDGPVAISHDWTHLDPADQEDVLAISKILGSAPVYEGKKAAEPISVITFMAGTVVGTIAGGFLSQVGADAWTAIKPHLNKLFRRKERRKAEQLLKISVFKEIQGANVEVVILATNPEPKDVDGLIDRGLGAIDRLLPMYANRIPDVRRLTFDYNDGHPVLLFGLSKDCRPWRSVIGESMVMPNDSLRFTLFKGSEASFLHALDDAKLRYRKHEPAPGIVMASGTAIEIVQTLATSGAIAAVLVAWLKARASRKIILNTSTKEVVHLEGYSVREIEALLPLVKSATAIDTASPPGAVDQPTDDA